MGGHAVCSVCLVTRAGACLCAPREQALGRQREGVGHTWLSFPDVAPPPGTHYTHWWPARQGGAGWVGVHRGVTFALCPCSTHSADRGNLGGIFSPISQWDPGLFFSSFGNMSFLDVPLLSCKRKLRSSRFPPLDAGTRRGETGLAAVPGDWMSVLAACALAGYPSPLSHA